MCMLTITIPYEEHEPFLQKAAEHIGKELKIDGFRTGYIPFNVIKEKVGEMRLLEVATEDMIKKALVSAVAEHNLETVGPPKIEIKKMVPGNDLEAEVSCALLPHFILPNIAEMHIRPKLAKVEDDEIEKSLQELRRMRVTEAATTSPAQNVDRVVVDMVISLDNVPIEGGTAKNHSIVLDETSYIQGLTKKLLGSTKGEVKKFTLPFPKDYYQKMLAGKDAEFEICIKEVYSRVLPDCNDDFAKSLHLSSLKDLKELLTRNLISEHERENKEKAKQEMLDTLLNAINFPDIPEILLEAEKEKLFAEFKMELENRGVAFEKYLADMKKTPEEIGDGMKDKALTRVKISLILRAYARELGVTVSDEEMEQEINDLRKAYKDEPNINERISQEHVRDYLRMNLLHRKTITALAEKIIRAVP